MKIFSYPNDWDLTTKIGYMSVNQIIELYLNKYNDTSNNFIKVFKRSNRAQPTPELRQS